MISLEKWIYKNINSCKDRSCATYTFVRPYGRKDVPMAWGCYSNCIHYIRIGNNIKNELEASYCEKNNSLRKEATENYEGEKEAKRLLIYPRIEETMRAE